MNRGPLKALPPRVVFLKPKEREFLVLCCRDIRYADIASKMGKSRRTIDDYRDALFLKLRIRSRTGLALWSIKYGIVKAKDIKI